MVFILWKITEHLYSEYIIPWQSHEKKNHLYGDLIQNEHNEPTRFFKSMEDMSFI